MAEKINVGVRAVIVKRANLDKRFAKAILLQQGPENNSDSLKFQLPGGKIEATDTSEAAIKQVLEKKYGLTNQKYTLLERLDGVFRDEEWFYHTFLVVLNDDVVIDFAHVPDSAESTFVPTGEINPKEISTDDHFAVVQGLLALHDLRKTEGN